ncbi:MAG: OmpA family protein [Candidatus Hydrogenedentes bacterium]|nr:OmpA family protein [Candidatus Hydrogenedentota bacterium]
MRNGRIGWALLAALIAAGCHTTRWEPLLKSEVTPRPDETVVLEKLLIVFDGSGSMTLEDKYTTAKRFLRSFIVAMPAGSYQVGALSFGGEWIMDWPTYPVQPFDRTELAVYADDLCPLMGSTFLAEALLENHSEVAQDSARTAVLVISDGKANNPRAALEAVDQLRQAHQGELCVYTVQVGDDEPGGQLLYDMAVRTGCGRGVHVDTVSTPEGLEALVREIFFGERVLVERLGEGPQTVLFGTGKSYIRPEYTTLLEDVARSMEMNPAMRLRIEGHADATGSESANADLSLRRAEAVKRALVERGVAPDRIETVGLGEAKPASPNDSPANRQLNRRVEFIVFTP